MNSIIETLKMNKNYRNIETANKIQNKTVELRVYRFCRVCFKIWIIIPICSISLSLFIGFVDFHVLGVFPF